MRCMKQIALLIIMALPVVAQTPQEINTVVMQSTFRLVGASTTGPSLGTAFIVGKPIPGSDKAQYVLVTAAHVLNALTGDTAVLFLRRKDSNGIWHEFPYTITIRANGQATWVKNPTADVAVMYISLPTDALTTLLPTTLFSDDQMLAQFEIHPGDELNVLGYPLGFEGPGGFPVLRSGKIASYPLIPAKDNPYFLLDFRVFEGNSGGPVYLIDFNRTYGGATRIGSVQMLMGLVSEEISLTEEQRGIFENRSERYPLGLAKIVPSAFIKETIDLLPAGDATK